MLAGSSPAHLDGEVRLSALNYTMCMVMYVESPRYNLVNLLIA